MNDEIRDDDVEAGIWELEFARVTLFHFNSIAHTFDFCVLKYRIRTIAGEG